MTVRWSIPIPSEALQERLFDWAIVLTYVLVVAGALGLSAYSPKYLANMEYYVRLYVCLFLIWRFNPFVRSNRFRFLTRLDRKIAFNAGMLILMMAILDKYVAVLEKRIKAVVDQMFHKK